MPQRDHQDHQNVILNVVDDPVVTGANTVFTRSSDEFHGTRWPGIARQQLDHGLYSAPSHRVEFAKLWHRGG